MKRGRPPENPMKGSLLDPNREAPPEPPPHLTDDERREWRALLHSNPHLGRAAVVSLVEAYVGAVVRRRRAAAILDTEGLTVEAAAGTLKPHPAVTVLQGAESAIASLSVKLGVAVSTKRDLPKAAQPPVEIDGRPGERPLRLA